MSPYQHGEVYVLDDGAETDLDLGHYERFTNAPLEPRLQLHHRQDLPVRHREGAAGRLPRQDRAGHPARHRRDQGRHPQAGRRRRGRGHHRDRRHGRRHRGAAVPRGDPPVRARRRQAELPVHPPDAGPVPEGRRRAEDQADAALASASCGRSASSPTSSSAAPSARSRRTSARRSRCSATSSGGRSSRSGTRSSASTRCRSAWSTNKLDELIVEQAGARPGAAAGHRRLAGDARPDAATPTHEVTIAVVGKYIKHRDAYKIGVRVARPRRHRPPTRRCRCVRVEAEEIERRRGGAGCWPGVDGVLVPGGFGKRGIEGKIEAIRYARETRACRSSASAWACSARSSSSPATCSGWRTPTAPSSTRTSPHPVVCLLDEQQSVTQIWAARMRLGAYPCHLQAGTQGPRGVRGGGDRASGTATATSSTTHYRERFAAPRHGRSPAPAPTAGWSR